MEVQDNSAVLAKLEFGPRAHLAEHVQDLWTQLSTEALERVNESFDVMDSGVIEFSREFVKNSDEYQRDEFLLEMLKRYPEELRTELRRVFHGFQLSHLPENEEYNASWILRWKKGELHEGEIVLI